MAVFFVTTTCITIVLQSYYDLCDLCDLCVTIVLPSCASLLNFSEVFRKQRSAIRDIKAASCPRLGASGPRDGTRRVESSRERGAAEDLTSVLDPKDRVGQGG